MSDPVFTEQSSPYLDEEHSLSDSSEELSSEEEVPPPPPVHSFAQVKSPKPSITPANALLRSPFALYIAKHVKSSPYGTLPLTNVALNKHGLSFSYLSWETTHEIMENEAGISVLKEHHLTLEVEHKELLLGLVRNCGAIRLHTSSDKLLTALSGLLEMARKTKQCSLCARVMVYLEKENEHCFSCMLRNELSPSVQTCSICQEETKHYLLTQCNHAFHTECLVKAKRIWSSDPLKEYAPFTCPNCRTVLRDYRY